jgi:hypothetical protein
MLKKKSRLSRRTRPEQIKPPEYFIRIKLDQIPNRSRFICLIFDWSATNFSGTYSNDPKKKEK